MAAIRLMEENINTINEKYNKKTRQKIEKRKLSKMTESNTKLHDTKRRNKFEPQKLR